MTFKLTIAALALVAAASAGYAQEAQTTQDELRWTIGPKVGLNASRFIGSDSRAEGKFKLGPVLGGALTYSASRHFGVTLEAYYTQKGERYSNGDRFRLHYAEVPVLFRYFFNAEGSVRPNIFLGPGLSVLAAARFVPDATDDATDFTNSYRPIDATAHGGLGLNVRVAETHWLSFDLRYVQGIIRVLDEMEDRRTLNSYNSTIQLSATYGFGF